MARRKLTDAQIHEWDMQTYDKAVKHPAYPLALIAFVAVLMQRELPEDFGTDKIKDRCLYWGEIAHEMAVEVLRPVVQTSYVPRPK